MAKVSTAAQTGALIPGPGALKASAIQAGLISLTIEQQEMVNKAKKYAMEQSIKSVLTKQSLAHQQQQQISLQRHQALVLMCRVYVGSISFELKEDTIRQAFSSFGPIKSINLSWDAVTQKHKGFAFVEFDLPEAAQLALDQMNGLMLGGRNIKVGRPSNMPQAAPIIQQITEEAKNHNRVYVSSIRQDLSEQDIQTVFGAFGVIKSCRLAQSGSAGQHKGYGFIEYENEQSVNDAVTAMQNFDLGGQSLKVGRAITPPENLSSTGTIANPECASILPAVVNVLAKIGQSIDGPSNPVSPNISATNDSSNQIASTSPAPSSPSQAITGSAPNQLTRQNVLNSDLTAETNTNAQIEMPTNVLHSNLIDSSGFSNVSSATQPNNNNDISVVNNQISSSTSNHQPDDGSSPVNPNDDQDSLQYQENIMTIKGAQERALLMQKLLRRNESRVCVLRNMVSIEDVDDDLKEEISEDCVQYGQLVSVVIYIEKLSDLGEAPDVSIKIFVEFREPSGAEKAKSILDGRFYSGRKIIAEIYDQNLYDACDYTG